VDESLRRVVDVIPGLVFRADPSGSFDFVNQCWCEYTGLSLDDARGSGWQRAICPEDLADVVAHWQALLSTGQPGEVEVRLRQHAGEYRWFSFRVAPFHDASGSLANWYGQAFDIDDRKRAEASLAGEKRTGESFSAAALADRTLRRTEAFLSEGERLSSTGSFCWRADNDEITWSEQTYRIYEIEPGTRISFALVDERLHPDDKALFKEMVARARGGKELAFEHRLLMPDQSVKYLHIVTHASRDSPGRLEYFGAVRDVTERRRSEDALNRVRSELAHVARISTLGALTASIAHEVNQPLSGIITNASTALRMLADNPPDLDGARETARRTIRDAHRASAVIARLRSLFRKQENLLEPVDLNEAAREVVALMRTELQRARVQLRLELDPTLPAVRGDRVQLQQVVLNLLRNAFEAVSGIDERARLLAIRTELEAGERVRLTVQDNGTGFDPSTSDRLFEAFYTTKSEGMGMGLSISRSIIESLHGRLWANTKPGAGASFTFSIPRADSQAKRAPDESRSV
jgi:PAS domain S-box-containing protein